MNSYVIYADGAFSPTRNVGGIAFIILNNNEQIIASFSKKFINTTNQRMEQLAVAIALESIKNPSNILEDKELLDMEEVKKKSFLARLFSKRS